MTENNIIKEYTNGEITVVWNNVKCIHSAKCFKNLPKVFNPKQKPWVKMNQSSTEKIINTVDICLSKALTYYYNR